MLFAKKLADGELPVAFLLRFDKRVFFDWGRPRVALYADHPYDYDNARDMLRRVGITETC